MVSNRAIQKVADEIARKFKPQKIILFGSYARGTASEDSDVDLMVVMPYRGKNYERATDIGMAVEIDFPSDILVRSDREIRDRLRMNDWFMHDVIEQGKTLYASRHTRMGRQSRRRLAGISVIWHGQASSCRHQNTGASASNELCGGLDYPAIGSPAPIHASIPPAMLVTRVKPRRWRIDPAIDER